MQSIQAPTNPLNYTKHLQHRSLGHIKDQTFTTEPKCAHKPPKQHQSPLAWVLGPYEEPHLHQSPQAPVNSLNHTSHLVTLTAYPTSTHKPSKTNQTSTLWLLGPYEGPYPHCRAHKCPQTPFTSQDTYAVGHWAIQGTASSL